MALAQVFQDAADCGPDAAAIDVHGAPAVLTAGGAAAELDMSAYGFSVPAEGRAGYGTLAARFDDLVSSTSVSFDGASFQHGVAEYPPAAAAAVTVGVQCGETDLGSPAYGHEGSTGGGTYGIATVAPVPPVERAPWPRTVEFAAHELTHHELTAQQEAGFQVAAGAFTASQISVPSAARQHAGTDGTPPCSITNKVAPYVLHSSVTTTCLEHSLKEWNFSMVHLDGALF
ncbi:hypothetical protein CYMTET_23016 [Cymbomonas tetramitiformis]|uniref:Uncharacterized protein n=1 Tax=Cymbomonas tetramitiformis TaxID=36881 RepID=A0AAE0FZ81_9CHLO|nr:hypothetical protein CYMTET_23016 [Cymbomonas tetramitiformis]